YNGGPMPTSAPDLPPTSTPSAPAVTSAQVPHTSIVPTVPGPSSGMLPASPSVVPQLSAAGEVPDLRSPALYLNRELSWIEFNARVLAEAENEAVPLLERLKFNAIAAANLDEFFMVRVAGLKQQLTGEVGELPADGLTSHEQLVKISARVHELVAQQMASLMGGLFPAL